MLNMERFKIQNICNKIKIQCRKFRYRERKIVKDKRNKIKYYVIRRPDRACGMFSYFLTTLGGIAEGRRRGLTPVVDFQNYTNAYLLPEEVGHRNAWEYYFLQPGNTSLQEALRHNHILANGFCRYDFPDPAPPIFQNAGGCLEYWRAVCRDNIQIMPELEEKIEYAFQKYLYGKGRVLGVSCRGTDYNSQTAKNHPIQPTIEQVMEKIDEVLSGGGWDAIYLTVEDINYIHAFQKKYKNKLVVFERDYIDYDYNSQRLIGEYYDAKRKDDKRIRGENYLISMLLLTKCAGLITSITSGSTAVMLLADQFEYFYFFDMGYWR